MKIGNLAFELAELRAEQERDASVRRAQAALRQPGRIKCAVCGDGIDADRRKALPSARRCFDCQARIERRQRKS